jgi:hypothetical protein
MVNKNKQYRVLLIEVLMKDSQTEAVRQELLDFVRCHPDVTIRAIAVKLGMPYSTLTKVLRDAGYRRRKYRKLADLDLTTLETRP